MEKVYSIKDKKNPLLSMKYNKTQIKRLLLKEWPGKKKLIEEKVEALDKMKIGSQKVYKIPYNNSTMNVEVTRLK